MANYLSKNYGLLNSFARYFSKTFFSKYFAKVHWIAPLVMWGHTYKLKFNLTSYFLRSIGTLIISKGLASFTQLVILDDVEKKGFIAQGLSICYDFPIQLND